MTVFYDPHHPAQAVLDRSASLGMRLYLLVSGALITLAIVFLIGMWLNP